MTLINDTVEKLFGHKKYKESEIDVDHFDFIKRAIKDAPNTVSQYYEYTSDRAIKDFLFEQTDVAKELKKLIEKLDDSPQEKNT